MQTCRFAAAWEDWAVNKQTLVKKIVGVLEAELEMYFRAARAAHAEATHEQSRAENKYDTRGLEASYLARGQSKQAAELQTAIARLQELPLRKFGPSDSIDLSALVEVEGEDESLHYFISPSAGGITVKHQKNEVIAVTPQSPIGQQLLGRASGHTFVLGSFTWKIKAVN